MVLFWIEAVGLAPIMGDLVIDGRLFWKLHPSKVCGVNKDGYRGVRIDPAAPKDKLRIAAFGDSSTYGLGVVVPDEVYPAKLGRILNERGLPSEVMNFGVPGYTIVQVVRLLRDRALPLRPDIATFCLGHNEGKTSRTRLADSNRRLDEAPFLRSSLARRFRSLRLWQFLRSRWLPIREVKEPSVRVPLDEFRELAAHGIELCRENGVTPVWIEYVELDPSDTLSPYVEAA
ncbi:unnamed protein product, partial [marine sediment metagenome]